MSKFKSKLAKVSMKNKSQERKANRSIKRVADLTALNQVEDSKLGYTMKDTIREEICYYGVILEYVDYKGLDIDTLEDTLNKPGADLMLYDMMMEIYLLPAYEFAHDTFDALNEQGYELGEYDNDAKEYIENKARNLDAIANTDDIVAEFKEAVISAIDMQNEWN